MLRAATVSALALALALSSGARAAHSQPLGRMVDTGEVPWPDGAYGVPVPVDGVRPSSIGALRSWRAPVSVHPDATVDGDTVRATLAHAERCLDALEFAHGLPAPQPDGLHGGDASLDVYVSMAGPESEAVVDALSVTEMFDRASAFVRVRASADRAVFQRRVCEAVARAMILGAKADHTPAFVDAMAATFARFVTNEGPDLDAWRALQSHPERAFWGRGRTALEARGSSLVLDLIEARWDDAKHKVLHALLWGASDHTPWRGTTLWNEPDVLDVAMRAFRDEPERFEGVLLEMSSMRAVVGTASDTFDLAGVRDPSLAVRPIRTVRYAELPRRVTSEAALDGTGFVTVDVDLADAPPGATMALWFHGAPWQRWMVRVMRVGADGHLARGLDSPVIDRGEWSLQMDVLDGYTKLTVVVLDLGDMTYEPDQPDRPAGFFSLSLGRGDTPSTPTTER